MADKTKMTVKGDDEVKRAFAKVAKEVSDLHEAHQSEADMLLPDIASATRRDTGTLAGAWQADSDKTTAKFVNEEEYAGVQEWGWSQHNIEPTHAILGAFEAHQSDTEAIYARAVADIADGANIRTED